MEDNRYRYGSFKLTSLRKTLAKAESDLVLIQSKAHALECAIAGYKQALSALESVNKKAEKSLKS